MSSIARNRSLLYGASFIGVAAFCAYADSKRKLHKIDDKVGSLSEHIKGVKLSDETYQIKASSVAALRPNDEREIKAFVLKNKELQVLWNKLEKEFRTSIKISFVPREKAPFGAKFTLSWYIGDNDNSRGVAWVSISIADDLNLITQKHALVFELLNLSMCRRYDILEVRAFKGEISPATYAELREEIESDVMQLTGKFFSEDELMQVKCNGPGSNLPADDQGVHALHIKAARDDIEKKIYKATGRKMLISEKV